jgi:hypothetical protein
MFLQLSRAAMLGILMRLPLAHVIRFNS